METINDLLIEFDEMGLAPTTPCPDPEEYVTEWREKVRAEFERLEAENAARARSWRRQCANMATTLTTLLTVLYRTHTVKPKKNSRRRGKMIKVGDKVICFTTGVKGIVIKQYYPTASPQQTMIQCFDGRKYHAPTSEFIKLTEEGTC